MIKWLKTEAAAAFGNGRLHKNNEMEHTISEAMQTIDQFSKDKTVVSITINDPNLKPIPPEGVVVEFNLSEYEK